MRPLYNGECGKEVIHLKIKKVDDKPMVIHTKQKAKIHAHESKQASIKGSSIYTVDRDPTKKKTVEGTHRKSTLHKVSKVDRFAKLRKNVKESNQSIKVNNHSLRNAGMVGGKVATDQIEGGEELQQSAMIMYEASRPVTGTASRGAELFKRQQKRLRRRLQRRHPKLLQKLQQLRLQRQLAHRFRRDLVQ